MLKATFPSCHGLPYRGRTPNEPQARCATDSSPAVNALAGLAYEDVLPRCDDLLKLLARTPALQLFQVIS